MTSTFANPEVLVTVDALLEDTTHHEKITPILAHFQNFQTSGSLSSFFPLSVALGNIAKSTAFAALINEFAKCVSLRGNVTLL